MSHKEIPPGTYNGKVITVDYAKAELRVLIYLAEQGEIESPTMTRLINVESLPPKIKKPLVEDKRPYYRKLEKRSKY